jgi:A/G-specific adenine glycosylase
MNAGASHDDFAPALLRWHQHHGRHDLPWQCDPTPYRVWVSEVMLQQTQVQTVIPFYLRFMQRFPELRALAAASMDEVLHYWSGLGYYSRARNLHRAAQIASPLYDNQLPTTFDDLHALPGIGRSTAGAILALSGAQRHPIMDGNVRRVLTRYFALEGVTGSSALEKQLWLLAEKCTPVDDVARYTQAIMDLGATVCVRSNPLCSDCPLRTDCVALKTGRQHQLPAPRRRAARPRRSVFMLVARRRDGSILLERRPERGIWGGLWCLPEFDSVEAAAHFSTQRLSAATLEAQARPVLSHAFTHFELHISPLVAECEGQAGVMDQAASLWYNAASPERVGLPAPIKIIIQNVTGDS